MPLKRNTTVGIILAAGKSTRFGSNKCLQKLPNGNEIGLQAALNLREQLDKIICVIPANSQEIKSLFERNGFQTIENSQSEKGISSSIKLGIVATKQAKSWLICLADMPNIQPTSYQAVIAELEENDTIVLPIVNQKQGNPVGISSKFYQQLMTLEGDVGAKQIFKNNIASIHTVDVDDVGILQDIDTQTDYSVHSEKNKQ